MICKANFQKLAGNRGKTYCNKVVWILSTFYFRNVADSRFGLIEGRLELMSSANDGEMTPTKFQRMLR